MKASGLGWAPEVPSHWDVAKICLLARLESGHTPSRQRPEYWVAEECTIPWFSLADIWQLRPGIQEYLGDTSEKISPRGAANSAARLLPAGTVVLSRTASVGFAGIMPIPMATTQDFANWVPGDRVSSEYLLYALRAMPDEFERVRYGSTHQTIYMPDIRRLAIPVPPRVEQDRIVRFLRERLPKVDELIAKKERLVALLAEERLALVTEFVTRGLDPSVPTRDSGVESIGVIPAHWGVVRIKHLMAEVVDCPHSTPEYESDGRFFAIRTADVDRGRLFLDGARRVSEATYRERTRRAVPRADDILYSREGERFGMAALVPPNVSLCLAQRMMMFRTKTSLFPAFAMWALNSELVFGQVRQDTIGATAPRINIPTIKDAWLACPDRAEQQAIASAIDRLGKNLDMAGERIGRSIERLREYRQALITSAVTGRLDVTHARSVAVHDDHNAEAIA